VTAVEIVTAEDAGEIAGVDAMNNADVMVSGTALRQVSRGRSIGRNRVGLIRRRLCFRR
jgi:hypothetical protein